MSKTFDTGARDGGETRVIAKLSLGAILLVLAGLGMMMLDDKRQTDPGVHTAAADHGG
jgi:hypothetical protein